MNAITKECSEKMNKSIDHFSKELASIRAGRANPAVLDKITVDYYGVPTAINAMAAVSVSESRILVIQPWDKTSIKEIEKAILASDIGINPSDDGDKIRLEFPKLTEERRVELSKDIKKIGEEATEIVIASKNPVQEEIKYEIADFLYHLMVLMVEKGIRWEDVMDELARR